jgi:LAS superfamily LD-carboxypeptidase LdcB
MEKNTHHTIHPKAESHPIPYIISIILLIATIALGILLVSATSQGKELRQTLTQKEADATAQQEQAQQETVALQATISNLESDRNTLAERLEEEEDRNNDFEKQISKLSGKVTVLDKIAKTDEELLKKYSKVAFLNENYIPKTLTNIPKKYLVSESKPLQFHGNADRFLEDLLDEAEDDGLDMRVTSAFRSFGTQSSLKANYTVIYGAGTANQFSADQGFSEHQLGTTVDFTTPTLVGAVDAFANTKEYEWLLDNAYKYGFILSYPQGNTYYQFEPWHWRFVGRDLAKYIDRKNTTFYELDQRTIDEYLVSLFD